MAKICAVCNKNIGFFEGDDAIQGINLHYECNPEFNRNPEKYGGKTIKKTEDDAIRKQRDADRKASEKARKSQAKSAELQQKIEDKSVHVKSFDMPFGDMVIFMVKWALASIPAFIILAIIGAIFFAIFTAIFVSTR